MLNNQQDKNEKLSPLRLLSDNSSDGLPSPDELKRIFFPKNSEAQLRSPLRHSSQTEVIILDDSPPIAELKLKRKVNGSNYESNGGEYSPRELDELENDVVMMNCQESLQKRLENVAESSKNIKKLRNTDSRYEKEQLRNEKEQQRLQKKRDRELAKAQKEAEKKRLKEFKEANAIRVVSTDKLQDTIICLESSLHDSEAGQAIKAQFEEKEAEILSVEHPVESSIQWRRKCLAEWDTSSQSFVPNEHGKTKIVQDKHIAIYLNMQRFIGLITNNQLIPTLNQLQSMQSECQIILIVEGLQKYSRDRKNLQSRSFQSLVLRGIANTYADDQRSTETSRKPRNNKSDKSEWLTNGPDRNALEDIMTMLQFEHRIMIIQTVDCTATASWVASLTANIATSTRESNDMLDFCMDGRTRSGVDSTDTWLKMLQNIQQCTEAVAMAIVREYPTLYSLYMAYTRCKSTADAEMLLADIEVQRSVITQRDRYVNKAMSKKIYNIIMSSDSKLVIA